MLTILLIIVLILLLGGGGYYGYNAWGGRGLGGILGLVLPSFSCSGSWAACPFIPERSS